MRRGGQTFAAEALVPVVVGALHRHPAYRDVFPIGAGIADWALA